MLSGSRRVTTGELRHIRVLPTGEPLSVPSVYGSPQQSLYPGTNDRIPGVKRHEAVIRECGSDSASVNSPIGLKVALGLLPLALVDWVTGENSLWLSFALIAIGTLSAHLIVPAWFVRLDLSR